MPDFFINNSASFTLEVDKTAEIGFRKCQVGATLAVKSHLTKSVEPALVSMPTGSGKTALMMAICFELKAKNALIITPSKVIRNQTAAEFSTLGILKKIGALPKTFGMIPKVKINRKKCSSEAIWKELIESYDIVVSTTKTVSPDEKGVVRPPNDSFDIVFIDEAHHSPARTWNSLIGEFGQSIVVLLTATPFRRDKKRIKAHLVYHYSIVNALNEEIYRTVDFRPVDTSIDESQKDELLAAKAVEIFREETALNADAKLLIKTKTIADAEKVKLIYMQLGLSVETIHVKKNDKENDLIIENCKQGRLNGIVCVGMVGEGLDIPQLKLAVLHGLPRTLPFTIQFIGRISRVNNGQKGNAILIADPRHVKGEVKKMYSYDAGWHDLIPSLVDKRVSGSTFLASKDYELLNPHGLNTEDFAPFFSVRIYETSADFIYKQDFIANLSTAVEVVLVEQASDTDPLIIVTKVISYPSWTKEFSIEEERFDLHVFYKIGNFLYECTTSDFILNKVKKHLLVKDSYKRVKDEVISRGLSDTSGNKYFMIGLSNTTGLNKNNPKYKMYLGSEVQAALRISDGRLFSAGHAVAKITDDETRGIALANSRVWMIGRDSIGSLKTWCDKINILISQVGPNVIPRMNVLADVASVNKIGGKPLACIFNSLIFNTNKVIVELDSIIYENPNPTVEILSVKDDEVVSCVLQLVPGAKPVRLYYNVLNSRGWTQEVGVNLNIFIDFGNESPFRGKFEDYLNDYPPIFILRTGETLIGNSKHKPKITTERFPTSLYRKQDWTGTDIRKEAKKPSTGFKYNVQDKVVEIIKPTVNLKKDIYVIDDRAHEVADIIVFRSKEKEIEFYHCKFKISKGDDPGVSLNDVNELLEQGIRSSQWIYASSLIDRLTQRIKNSSSLHGSKAAFSALQANFYPYEWKYKVILVQPGLSIDKLLISKVPTNVEKLFVSLLDRTHSAEASLEVWGG